MDPGGEGGGKTLNLLELIEELWLKTSEKIEDFEPKVMELDGLDEFFLCKLGDASQISLYI